MIDMQKVIWSGISTKRLTPVMVGANKPAFKYERKCIRCMDRDHIHHPHFLLREGCSKSAYRTLQFDSMTKVWCTFYGKERERHRLVVFLYIPSIDGFHVHHISNIWPVNTQSSEIGFFNNGFPVLGVCNQLIFITQPVGIPFEPLGPFLWPLCPVLFNSRWNGVQASLHRNIPVEEHIRSSVPSIYRYNNCFPNQINWKVVFHVKTMNVLIPYTKLPNPKWIQT